MRLYSLEGYRTMCGMHLMLINLWPFTGALISSSGLKRWGKQTDAGRELPFLQSWLHLDFTELQTVNAFLSRNIIELQNRLLLWGVDLSSSSVAAGEPLSISFMLLWYFYECKVKENNCWWRHQQVHGLLSVWHGSHSEKCTHYEANLDLYAFGHDYDTQKKAVLCFECTYLFISTTIPNPWRSQYSWIRSKYCPAPKD